MSRYDPEIIQEHADALYSEADRIVSAHTRNGMITGGACGLLLGVLAGGVGAVQAGGGSVGAWTCGLGVAGVFVGGKMGCAIGKVRGRAQAFVLMLQAQTALCQVRIEENTRKPPVPIAPNPLS